MAERTMEVIEFIASFLVDMTGNEIFEKWKAKRKISKILKKDKDNIKRIFYEVDNSDLYNLIEEFIMFSAFKEVSFYSSMNLTMEQEENLWRKFSDFIKEETGDKYVNGNYKDKIIRCINLHNKAINSIIMDDQGIFHTKMMQNQHTIVKDSLNYIIDTLNTETKLQDEDDELNFSVEQLEMIIKSCRFDASQLRKIQIISICGAMLILLFMSVFIPLSLKDIENIYSTAIMTLFFAIVVLLLIMFWKNISLKLQKLEDQIEKMRSLLWETHFMLYKNQIENKYTKNSNEITEFFSCKKDQE